MENTEHLQLERYEKSNINHDRQCVWICDLWESVCSIQDQNPLPSRLHLQFVQAALDMIRLGFLNAQQTELIFDRVPWITFLVNTYDLIPPKLLGSLHSLFLQELARFIIIAAQDGNEIALGFKDEESLHKLLCIISRSTIYQDRECTLLIQSMGKMLLNHRLKSIWTLPFAQIMKQRGFKIIQDLDCFLVFAQHLNRFESQKVSDCLALMLLKSCKSPSRLKKDLITQYFNHILSLVFTEGSLNLQVFFTFKATLTLSDCIEPYSYLDLWWIIRGRKRITICGNYARHFDAKA